MSRNLLHISKLDAFKAWMDASGIEWRPARGEYQVLQVEMLKGGWACIYWREKMPEHYTVDVRIEPLVQRFIQAERSGFRFTPGEVATLPPKITFASNGNPIDELGGTFDTGWYFPSEGHPGYARII